MSDPTGPFLSVRGDARQTVAPDYVTLASTIDISRGSKGEALRAAAARLDRLIADLATLGAEALSVETERRPLTWSAQSATTHAEREHNDQTGHYEPTGRVTATVAVLIAVRDFGLLDSLGAVLAARETLSVHEAAWEVDWDNPAWPDVRAAAIQAAIRKGRDYAAALGGSLRSVEHIADVGLLGGGEATQYRSAGGRRAMSASGGREPDTPSLDPVPQELTATIEARFIATGVSLTGADGGELGAT
jgi:uncharacterized protein YggE